MTNPAEQYTIGVGIDTARYGHHVSFLGPDREIAAPPVNVAESHEGYERLRARLEKLRKKHPEAHFHFHIDAAGQYAANLERYVRRLDLPKTVSIGEPKRNKDYHRAVSPKRKSDASESAAMARFAVNEQPDATPETDPQFAALREIASRLEGQVKSTTQAVNRLHNLMARVFPELAALAPCFSAAWVLSLLRAYPTPQRIAQARPMSLEKIPHVSADRARQLQTAAKTSVGSLSGKVAEELVAHAVAEVQHAQQAADRLESLLLQAFDALPGSGHVQLQTIAGIGRVTAAVLTAKMIDVARFETPEHLVGYFGVFPEEYSSGVDSAGQPRIRRQHMSRKGNDLVRRYLFCAAKSAIVHNPAARALYKRLRSKGTRGDVALGHVMRKLLHLAFAVWATDKPFDKNHFPWEPSEDAETSKSEDVAEEPARAAPANATSSKGNSPNNEKSAGRKREVIPTRKAVTADSISVADPSSLAKSVRLPKASNGSIDFAYVRGQVTIQQVLDASAWQGALSGNGAERRGACPLHEAANRRSRSFAVNVEKNVFQCFHPECGARGNALDLWAALRQETIYQAAQSLAERLDLKTTRNREEEPVTQTRSTT